MNSRFNLNMHDYIHTAGGKLFFNRQLELDYSKTFLPQIYRHILKDNEINSKQQNLIRPALN